MRCNRGAVTGTSIGLVLALLCSCGCARSFFLRGDWSLEFQRGIRCTETTCEEFSGDATCSSQPAVEVAPSCEGCQGGGECEPCPAKCGRPGLLRRGGLLRGLFARVGQPHLRRGPVEEHFPRFHPVPTHPVFGGAAAVCPVSSPAATPLTSPSLEPAEIVPVPASPPKSLNPPPAPLPEAAPSAPLPQQGDKPGEAGAASNAKPKADWQFDPTHPAPLPGKPAISPDIQATRPVTAR